MYMYVEVEPYYMYMWLIHVPLKYRSTTEILTSKYDQATVHRLPSKCRKLERLINIHKHYIVVSCFDGCARTGNGMFQDYCVAGLRMARTRPEPVLCYDAGLVL